MRHHTLRVGYAFALHQARNCAVSLSAATCGRTMAHAFKNTHDIERSCACEKASASSRTAAANENLAALDAALRRDPARGEQRRVGDAKPGRVAVDLAKRLLRHEQHHGDGLGAVFLGVGG
jgi:hypothetical protein